MSPENLRRIFYRWLSAARASRHRRVTLQQKEAELKHGWLEAAWDKWRDRYLHEKLRPLVSVKMAPSEDLCSWLLFRNSRLLLRVRQICSSGYSGSGTQRQGYGLNALKLNVVADLDQSLPAIRFHASHIKGRYWQIWRSTMPRALQAKKARDLDRQLVLRECLLFSISGSVAYLHCFRQGSRQMVPNLSDEDYPESRRVSYANALTPDLVLNLNG
jgi:protein SFI1